MRTLEHSQKLLTHDVDAFGLWRPDSAFRLMQEIAAMHSASLGFPRQELLRRGRVWMLARVHLLVERYPQYLDDIHALTWCGPAGKITYPRYIEITDGQGDFLAAVSTSWVVVDTAVRRIMLPEKANLDLPACPEIVPRINEPGKLRPKKAGEKTLISRAPLYSDLDINGHMNNASYVSFVFDLFDLDWLRDHRIRSFTISYSAEAKYSIPIQMTLYRDGLHFEVLGSDEKDGHVVFEAAGEFTRVDKDAVASKQLLL